MYTLASNISVAETEYGVVLLDESGGEYWNLNPTGAVVLRSVLRSGTVQAAVEAIVSEFSVDPEMAGLDVRTVIDDLVDARLIIPA